MLGGVIMKHYDTIIIGGGLAGCVLGYLLKQQDKNVLIIEKQSFKNKNKLCGGLLTEKSYDLLIEIYGDSEIEDLITNKHTSGIITNNNKSFTIKNINTYSVYRKKLDDYVLNKYLSVGGEILDNTTYSNVNFSDNTLSFNEEKYTFSNIVGADGIFSQLRKDVTGKNQRNNFALELLNSNKKFNLVNIFFFNRFKGLDRL